MGTGATDWRRRGRGGWLAALALSLGAHVVVLLALLWRIAPLPTPAPTPTIEVVLTRPDAPASVRGSQARRLRAARPSAPPQTPSAIASAPPVAPAPPVATTPKVAAPTEPPLRGALQAALGCRESNLPRLSPSQRKACQERLAQGLAARAGGAFGMDPARRAAFDEAAREREPFLARTPKDNCVPRLQEKEVGRGAMATHDWKAGGRLRQVVLGSATPKHG